MVNPDNNDNNFYIPVEGDLGDQIKSLEFDSFESLWEARSFIVSQSETARGYVAQDIDESIESSDWQDPVQE